jgi:hypothetical protein
MSKEQTISTAARAVELYGRYRAAVTAFPYDPIAAGEAFRAWLGAMEALSGAARAQVGRRIARETSADAVARAAAALPLAAPDAVRFLTQTRILLEEGAGLEALLAGMAAVEAAPGEAAVIRGTHGDVTFEARRLPDDAYAVRVEDADGRVTITRVASLEDARSLLGLRDELD